MVCCFPFDEGVSSAESSESSSGLSSLSMLEISGGEKCPDKMIASRAMAITVSSSREGEEEEEG